MAEGHSVARWARRLQGLVGQELVRVDLPDGVDDRKPSDRPEARCVVRVDTHGKHLLIRFDDGHTLHCHALMYGSWQFGAPGMELRKDPARVRVRLQTERFEAVFFNGPVVELLDADQEARHRSLSKLGPDVLHEPFDRDEAWSRMDAKSELPIGDAVLRQELVAGIGNIYKSEALFLSRIAPTLTIAELGRKRLERFWNAVVPMMREGSRSSGPITTVPGHIRRRGARNWVYRRKREPCFFCGRPIVMTRQGPLDRSTYFCLTCQR